MLVKTTMRKIKMNFFQFTLIMKKMDQKIEEWVHQFINQVEDGEL